MDEHPAVRPLGVATAEREHVRQRVAVVDRHQLAPGPRVGGVQREGEPDRLRDLLDEALEAGDPADRRDGRAPMRDADLGELPRGVEHRVDVHERLAHPHEHEMVHRLGPPEVEDLVEDLRGGQVAPERHAAGSAEVCMRAGSPIATRRTPSGVRRGSA